MDNREIIMKSAISIFVENGFNNSPIIKIINEAKISNGTFYYYFKTKKQLINECYIFVKTKLNNYVKPLVQKENSNIKKLEHILIGFILWGYNNKKMQRFIDIYYASPFIENNTKIEGANMFYYIRETINNCKKESLIQQQDTDLIIQLLAGTIKSTLNYLYIKDSVSNLDEIKDYIFKMLK